VAVDGISMRLKEVTTGSKQYRDTSALKSREDVGSAA
jgi:hypothetical protein